MHRLVENLVRAAMNNVDIWRVNALRAKGWKNALAIAGRVAFGVRVCSPCCV
jgi:hypothetical protein